MWGDKEEDYKTVITHDDRGRGFIICEPHLPRSHTMYNGCEVKLDWMVPIDRYAFDQYECFVSELRVPLEGLIPGEQTVRYAHSIAEQITKRFRARFGTKTDSKSS